MNAIKKSFVFTLLAFSLLLVSCSTGQILESESELSVEELESTYVQKIAGIACVQLMSEYNENQLAIAIKYFRIIEAIVGGPWVGITREVIEKGNSGEIYISRCLG